MVKETLVVNFYGGPGTGKSTMCAGVFAKLKWSKVNCEMALEYAKGITWEGSLNKLENQVYLFGKQHHMVFRLLDKVDVVLTDSPLLLSLVYGPEDDVFRNFVKHEYGKMRNCDIFLRRVKEYNQAGRTQNLEEAKKIDDKLLNILAINDGEFHTFVGEQESEEKIKDMILNILNK